MNKTFAPQWLRGADLRALLDALAMTPAQAAKFLQVTERSVFRWLADDCCPWPVLALLWHESPAGRHECALDLGNEVQVLRGLAGALQAQLAAQAAQLARLLAISDSGAANDALGAVAVAGGLAVFLEGGFQVVKPNLAYGQVDPDGDVDGDGWREGLGDGDQVGVHLEKAPTALSSAMPQTAPVMAR